MGGLLKEDTRKSCTLEDQDKSISVLHAGRGWWLMESYVLDSNVQVHDGFPAIPSPTTHRNLRVFAGTWNVGGRAPDRDLINLRDWLMMSRSSPSSSPAADMYVLGFQEIVPLNAANVLIPEDQRTTTKWLSLIRDALEDGDESSRRGCSSSFSEEELLLHPPFPSEDNGYRLVASKQMVGIFLCVWVRAELMTRVSSTRVSCVGTGIMGCMGNKGSVSISMTLEQTTLCFVCTHLASGEREIDRVRRNSDVMEILKRTRFRRQRRRAALSPITILEHDRIIWLGDLNYRLADPGRRYPLDRLQKEQYWLSLLEKDELLMEQKEGRVLDGWEEGSLNFPPTYKYLVGSDQYAIRLSKSGSNRRTPAWCDRILWRGKGMKQTCYERGESRFSDHRPVYSVFDMEIGGGEAGEREGSEADQRAGGCSARSTRGSSTSAEGGGSANCRTSGGRVQAEELLSGTWRTMSCLQVSRF